MTVALISVATRHGGDHGSGREAVRAHDAGPSATPSTGGSDGPATSSRTPAPQPSTTAHGGTTDAGETSRPGQSGGTGQASGVATLPNTGNSTQTIELAALAMLFIAGGSFGVRISRPKSTGSQPDPATAVTQSAQAVGSAASNRPGTC